MTVTGRVKRLIVRISRQSSSVRSIISLSIFDVLKRLVPDEANNCVGMVGANNVDVAR